MRRKRPPGAWVRPTLPPPPGARPAGLPPSAAHTLMAEQARLVRAQADALELDNAERRRRLVGGPERPPPDDLERVG